MHCMVPSAWQRVSCTAMVKERQENMSIIGKVESLWRYPVKSMRGEEVDTVFLGFAGIYGDRFFAFKSVASPKGFPYLTGREQPDMLRYRPRFRHPEQAARPPISPTPSASCPACT